MQITSGPCPNRERVAPIYAKQVLSTQLCLSREGASYLASLSIRIMATKMQIVFVIPTTIVAARSFLMRMKGDVP